MADFKYSFPLHPKHFIELIGASRDDASTEIVPMTAFTVSYKWGVFYKGTGEDQVRVRRIIPSSSVASKRTQKDQAEAAKPRISSPFNPDRRVYYTPVEMDEYGIPKLPTDNLGASSTSSDSDSPSPVGSDSEDDSEDSEGYKTYEATLSDAEEARIAERMRKMGLWN